MVIEDFLIDHPDLVASDHPFLPMERALAESRSLPLEDASMDAALGGAAASLLRSADG